MDIDDDDLEEIIQHFTHPHPLKLTVLDDLRSRVGYDYYACYCCSSIYTTTTSTFSSAMYVCEEAECCNEYSYDMYTDVVYGVYLCVLCGRLEESVERHALHRHPRLNLVDSQYCEDSKCGGCNQYFRSLYSYKCDTKDCDFEMHVKCAHSLKPTIEHRHRSHSHLFILIVYHDYVTDLCCDFCHRHILLYGCAFLRCVPCNLNYHIYCDRNEQRYVQASIMYPRGHPQHPLSLSHCKSDCYWSCDVCNKKREWPMEYVYSCSECNNFTAHVSCVFQNLPCPSSNLVNNNVDVDMRIDCGALHENAQCQGCKKRFLDGRPVYGCQHCNFYVHESCCMHRNGRLVLVFAHGRDFTCACCGRICSGFMFQDRELESFVVGVECMLLKPSTFFEIADHKHLVVLLQESNATKNSYLRCFPCNMNFSITESRCHFPHTLLHECHFHPLTLVSRLTENGNDDDQCYCDVCEEKRDPNQGIYYCTECKFEAHIACVKSEVLRLSRNKPEDVKFVTLKEITQNEEAEKKIQVRDVFRLKQELQHSYTRVEKELDDIFPIASKITWESVVFENPCCNNEPRGTLYSDNPFKKFIQGLNSSFVMKKTPSILKSLMYEEVVRIGEYPVPLNFDESVLETLFNKYGDLGVKCTCSPEVKQCIFVGLCKTLQSMCNTKVVRVTENLLVEWWTWFAMGKAAGFQVQFGFKILERVVYAHFGLEADCYAVDEFANVRKETSELPEIIQVLKRELDEARRKLEGAVKKERQLREEAFRVKKSALMKKCLMEAEDLVCYSVGEMLFPSSSSE